MWNRDRWVEIFETLSKNKLRASLSGLRIAMGILFLLTF